MLEGTSLIVDGVHLEPKFIEKMFHKYGN